MTTLPSVLPPSDPYPVLVSFADRAKQRRWTVLLRIFLVLPLAVVTFVFAIVTFLLVIIGWFGALFTGRTPKFVRDMTTITLRLSLRLYTYLYLLTDHFPSFALDAHPDDTVRVAVPATTRMNRWATFFRLILVIPVGVLSSILGIGALPFHIFGWLAALITGWLPTPIYDMDRALIRFQSRVVSYQTLLVPTYPSKLFGDSEPLPEMDGTLLPPVTPVIEPSLDIGPHPDLEGPSWAQPTGPPKYASTHPGAFPAAPTVGDIAQPKMHVSWLVLLGKGGKRLLVVAIIIGVPVYIARIVNQVHHGVAVVNDQQLVQANNVLVSQITQFESRGKSCQTAGVRISCLESNDARLAGELTTFVSTLSSNRANSDISPHVISRAEAAARQLASVFHTVSQAGSSESAFKKAANVHLIDSAANDVEVALGELQTALNNR
jgi:hypothetical protein